MDRRERARDFALKAHAADRKVALAADAELRQAWEDVARNWRLMARHLRALAEAEAGEGRVSSAG